MDELNTFDSLQRVIAALGPVPEPQEVLVHSLADFRRVLEACFPNAVEFRPVSHLFGIPIVVDPKMRPGEYEIRPRSLSTPTEGNG